MLDKLIQAHHDDGYRVSAEDLVRRVITHVIDGFREEWDDLPQSPDGVRRLDFYDDIYPAIIFYAALESTTVYDLSLKEETVVIFDARVVKVGRGVDDVDDQ